MTDASHARFLDLVARFYAGSRLSDADLTELTRLYAANAARVFAIITE